MISLLFQFFFLLKCQLKKSPAHAKISEKERMGGLYAGLWNIPEKLFKHN